MGAILNDGRLPQDSQSPHELAQLGASGEPTTSESMMHLRTSTAQEPRDAALQAGVGYVEHYHLPYVHEFFREFPHLREFACGGTAAAINIVITFPPNKIMFRQQLFGLNTWDAYQNVKNEGLAMLYRGVKPPLLQAAVSKSIMFGLYNWYDEFLVERLGSHKSVHLLAAGLSGTTEAVLAPFERAQTLLQTPKFNREITGAYDAIVHLNKFGLREHYRGLSAILFRNGPGNMLFFGLREPLRDSFPRSNSATRRMVNDFVCGAVLGAVISTVSFPINVARTRMQSVYGEPFIGTLQALRLTYEERGHSMSKLYRGVHMNFFRSLLSWGIINSAYEKLKSIT
uniref:Mitochondrial carrier protein n=1 Tax=Globisporangium ultimum (strain ATCC 200006 / CBS 805.95 / DAOM BR144) TaxID=431595 RepID=K3W5I0_GLOUD